MIGPQDGRKLVVNNNGDRVRPLSRVVGPLPNGHSWLINEGH